MDVSKFQYSVPNPKGGMPEMVPTTKGAGDNNRGAGDAVQQKDKIYQNPNEAVTPPFMPGTTPDGGHSVPFNIGGKFHY